MASTHSPLQPTALVALPRLAHPACCSCFVCSLDEALPVREYQLELSRADREEDSSTDDEIDAVRELRAEMGEAA